jgi:polysaccharide pyruvyl transferase CsaB
MPVIGISGSYGGLNLGDEAILSAAVGEICSVIPDAEIVVFSRDAEHTRRSHPVDRVINPRTALREEIEPEVARLDLLLLGGGGILYDSEAKTYLREVTMAHEMAIPTFAFAIGAGPLENEVERAAVRDGLERMAGITVRETAAKRLLEEIGVRKPVTVTADPAFLLEAEPFPHEALEKMGIPLGERLVGISLREVGSAAPDLAHSSYHGLLADTADFIVRRWDARVVFVPMEMADLREAHRVVSLMHNPQAARILEFGHGPRRILGLMTRFEFAVGMRLHFLIFAALARVPFMPLPYASKVADLVQMLGLPERTAVPEESAGLFLADLDRLWDGGQELWPDVWERVLECKNLARETAPLAAEIVKDGAARSRDRQG